MQHLDIGHLLQQFGRHVGSGCRTRRGVGQGLALRARDFHQAGNIVRLERGIGHDNHMGFGQLGDAAQIAHGIEWHLGMYRGIDDMRGDDHADGVSIRCRLCNGVGADQGTRSRLIFDDHGDRPFRCHRFADNSGDDVSRPAGRERHDETDVMRWKSILRRSRGAGKPGEGRHCRKKPSAVYHDVPHLPAVARPRTPSQSGHFASTIVVFTPIARRLIGYVRVEPSPANQRNNPVSAWQFT